MSEEKNRREEYDEHCAFEDPALVFFLGGGGSPVVILNPMLFCILNVYITQFCQ